MTFLRSCANEALEAWMFYMEWLFIGESINLEMSSPKVFTEGI